MDTTAAPAPAAALSGTVRADLAVVGGGFTGLWTALLAKSARPDRSVVLVEGNRVGWAASGRNGGFADASLTHGDDNGRRHFPAEADRLREWGRRNLDAIEAAVAQLGIDCGWERTGALSVAVEPYQVAALRAADGGDGGRFLDAEAVRSEVASPTYLAGRWQPRDTALVDPARLAWGLRAAALAAGVRLYERSPVRRLGRDRAGVRLQTPAGLVLADRVALGTNAFPSLLRRVRPYLLPVYDYVLVTEPLSARQRDDVGWRHRQGVDDLGNQFHYYRLTPDDRILWGGYDAVYHYGRRVHPRYDQRPATFLRLADHFFRTFPQLAGLRFSHRWGGAIDTCSRFCPFFGTAHGGRVAYAAGYTGLGVAATRFAATTLLELLDGTGGEASRSALVRTRPRPFPPEPLTSLGVALTRWSLAAADRREGRRNLWLRALDRAGMGYDS